MAVLRSIIILLCFALCANAANLLRNSGFELGRADVSFAASERITSLPGVFLTSDARSGELAFRLEASQATNLQTIVFAPVKLKPNTEYTLSWYTKKSAGASYDQTVSLVNTFGGDATNAINTNKTTWDRWSFSYITTNAPESTYRVEFKPKDSGYPGIWISFDDFQLEEGAAATDYAPMSPIEFAWQQSPTNNGNIFFNGTAPILPWVSTATNTCSVTCSWWVLDWQNNLIDGTNSTALSLTNGVNNGTVSPTVTTNGFYRLMSVLDDIDHSRTEILFSMIAVPDGLSPTNKMVGGHFPPVGHYLTMASNLSIGWNRSVSVTKAPNLDEPFTWDIVEASEGSTTLFTNLVAQTRLYGLEMLATLNGEIVNTPAWAVETNGHPYITNYQNFASNMVSAYSPWVTYWELWNEPDSEGGLSGEEAYYAILMTNTASMIKEVDSGAAIIGMTASIPGYAQTVHDLGYDENVYDIVSHHHYPSLLITQPTWVPGWRDYCTTNGVSLWMTEGGPVIYPFYFNQWWADERVGSYPVAGGANPDREQIRRGSYQLMNFARCLFDGYGVQFMYDQRLSVGLDTFTKYASWEWDHSPSATLFAWGTLGTLFKNVRRGGSIQSSNWCEAYYYTNDTGSVGIFYLTNETKVATLTTEFDPSAFTAYDMMGATIAYGSGIKLTANPVYIFATDVETNVFATNWHVALTTDTTAPIPVVHIGPNGIITATDQWFSWNSLDDVNRWTPGVTNTNSVVYSWKLDGVTDWNSYTWTNQAYVSGLSTNQQYTFYVRAKDASDNVGETSYSFGPEPTTTFTNIHATGKLKFSGKIKFNN